MWGNPEFHYNNALGTCLVYTEVVDGLWDREINSVFYLHRITDIYSNKVLAYSRYFVNKRDQIKKEILMPNLVNVGDAVNLSPDRFAVVKAELFDSK
jgi:hypothetical protein